MFQLLKLLFSREASRAFRQRTSFHVHLPAVAKKEAEGNDDERLDDVNKAIVRRQRSKKITPIHRNRGP
jgi:hypothetical protein